MNYVLVSIIIYLVLIGIICFLCNRLFKKRQLVVSENNKAVEDIKKLRVKLDKDKKNNDEKFKNAKDVDDALDILANILSNNSN